MTDDISDIADMYNRDTEREHARLEEHQLEYDEGCGGWCAGG